jgi:two-component system response regulator RegX3
MAGPRLKLAANLLQIVEYMAKLLVADDEQSVRDTLAYFLRQSGYEVVTAENGTRALELFNTEPFDGALVDLLMPGLDGLAVCKAIREKSAAAGRDFPVWIVTGARSHEAANAAAQHGVRALIGKPFDWMEFRSMLEREFNRDNGPAPTAPADPAPAGGTTGGLAN